MPSTPRTGAPSATTTQAEQKIEIVNFCVSGFGMIERPSLPKLAGQVPARTRSRKAARPVYFDGALRDTQVYDRATLPPGAQIAGPAIVEEFGSTTVVFPGQVLRSTTTASW